MTRIKIIIVVFISILLLTDAIYTVSNKVLLDSYFVIEYDRVVRNLVRTDSAIENYQSNLSTKLSDWSQWDDTFQFVQDRNDEYINSNLAVSTMKNLGINYMAFFNTQGELIYSLGTDLVEEVMIPSESVALEIGTALNLSSQDETTKGRILTIDNKPLFVQAQIITHTSGEGNAGTMLFARYFDEPILNEIKTLTQRDLSLIQLHDQNVPEEVREAVEEISTKGGYYIPTPSEQTFTGYTAIKNAQGEILGVIQLPIEREIYIQGKEALATFVLIAAFAVLIFGTIIIVLIEYLLLKPLLLLSKEVKKISVSNLRDTELHVHGNDEIGALATSINSLLRELARAQESETEAKKIEREVRAKLQKSLSES